MGPGCGYDIAYTSGAPDSFDEYASHVPSGENLGEPSENLVRTSACGMARVDNVYGDKNVFCSCVPIEAFAGEIEAFSEPNVS